MPVLGRFRVSLEHPTLDALDLGGAQTGLAPGADGQLLLNVVNLRAVVLAGFSYRRTSFPVRSALRCAVDVPCGPCACANAQACTIASQVQSRH